MTFVSEPVIIRVMGFRAEGVQRIEDIVKLGGENRVCERKRVRREIKVWFTGKLVGHS